MCAPCPCGQLFHFCPCCGRRLSATALSSSASAATRAPLATAPRRPLPPAPADPPTRTPVLEPPCDGRASAAWSRLLPATPVSAFDVFVSVVGACEASEDAPTDPVVSLVRAWCTEKALVPAAAGPRGGGEAALARAWLTAPQALRHGCEDVAGWWTTSCQRADPPLRSHPDGAEEAPCAALDKSVPTGEPGHDTARSTALVGAASLSAAKRAPPKSTKRFPSSFDLFRRAVKRKSLTQKAVCDLWATMSDSDKAPYDVQAAGLRTLGLLETMQNE